MSTLDYVFLDCTFGRFQKIIPASTRNPKLCVRWPQTCCSVPKLWPYCKPCILYFALFTLDWNLQKCKYHTTVCTFEHLANQNLFLWLLACDSNLLLCSCSLIYVKVISEKLCKQYFASVSCESWPFFGDSICVET